MGLLGPMVSLLIATQAAASPTAARLDLPDGPRLAALSGGRLHVAAFRDGVAEPLGTADAAAITSLAPCPEPPGWYAAADRDLFRRSINGGGWLPAGTFDEPIQQLMPAPGAGDELVILTGRPGEPVLEDSKVWRLRPGAKPRRVAAVEDGYRPWRMWPAHRDGRPQLAAATFKRTRFMPFEHNCLFLFAWGEKVSPTWLGSALSRPYIDACHSDLRGDGIWRLIALELTAEASPSLGVYSPIGFGYHGEWRSAALDGVERIKAFGDAVVLAGESGTWQLLRDGDGYRIVRLNGNPSDLDGVVRADQSLLGNATGDWLAVQLQTESAELARGED